MNSEYSRVVEKLSASFSDTVSSSEAFTQKEASSFRQEISNRVLPLLNSPKPKILVYGIYNGGKSTLVNSICGREVASVADRPETHKITAYDAGKYVLIDSPGIDAPEEDEQIADEQIKACHVILFVVSSRGGFESNTNYRKMWDLMQRQIPFIIVLNDRGVPTNEESQHLVELNSMKSKIIKNLMAVSGRNDIEKKYEVIVVNALRAWRGVEKNNDGFTKKSNITELTSRIDQLLEGKEALKTYLAPLSALEDEINRAEEILSARKITENFARRRTTLQQKFSDLKSSMDNAIRYTASMYTDEIYHCFLGEGGRNISDINSEIVREIGDKYRIAVSPILEYIRKSFADINISADASGNVSLSSPDKNLMPVTDSNSEKDYEPDFSDYDSSPSLDWGKIMKSATEGAMAGGATGTVVPFFGTLTGAAGGAILAGAGELIRQIFGGDNGQKEFERRQREVEAYNRRLEQKIEEDKRRRQDARTAANAQVNSAVKELQAQYSELIEKIRSSVTGLIDRAAAKNSASNAAVDKTMNALEGLKAEIHQLRQKIA